MANPEHELRLRMAATDTPRETDFANCDLSGIRLPSANLSGFGLHDANLRRADLSGAYMHSADLSNASLAQCQLVGADMRAVNLRGASLKSPDLSAATLIDADLRDAELAGCKLTKCKLNGAKLEGANLTKADLRGVRGITVEQIQSPKNWTQAIFDGETARALGLDQAIELSRHGAKPKPSRAKKSFAVDIVCTDIRPTFGDVFRICGSDHPRFPPSGICDLSPVASFGFEQTDDYFAIPDADGEPILWLYPLIGSKSVCHHEGPFDGLRLELPQPKKASVNKLLAVASQLIKVLGGTLFEVTGEIRGDPLTQLELQQRLEALVSKR